MDSPGLGPIGQIALVVNDIERATAFYRDLLQLKFLFSAPPALAFFDLGGIRLMLSLPEADTRPGGALLYFKVEDIAASHQTLAARGVLFVGEPHLVHKAPGFELWMAFFHDSEGNALALMHEKHGVAG